MIFQDQHSAERYSLSSRGRWLRLGPHFVLNEFASGDGADIVLVHPCLVGLLEVIRAHFDKPVIINSGYRTPAHNQNVGGSSGSKHMLGLAADIRLPGISPEEVARYADNELKAGGVGRYSSFTHVDVANYRRWSG